jgi:hypothetical protein
VSKLILCSGERAQRPYTFTSSGVRIYSIEELCFYLYHNVYLIDEAMLQDDLFEWIGMECKLAQRAQKLKQLKLQDADLKTLVTVILCSADYYTETEIKEMLRILDDMLHMPAVKRNCRKAENFLANRKFKDAAAEYERIIHSKAAAGLTPEEFGDLYHNLAVAKVHTSGFLEASRLFLEAYQRNHREESLIEYLSALLLMKDRKSFLEKSEEFEVSETLMERMENFLQEKECEAKETALFKQLEEIQQQRDLGRTEEFYTRAEKIMETWKAEIRQVQT